jgi:hypothetical protein
MRLDDDITTAPAIAAIRPTTRYELLAPEIDESMPTVSGSDMYACRIDQ